MNRPSIRQVIALAVACVGIAACGPLAGVGDTAPVFGEDATVPNRTYLVSSITCTLDLPAANGGDGALIYSVATIPDDWVFDSSNRKLVVYPTLAGAWDIRYRVVDSDENTEEEDAAELAFTITVKDPAALPPSPEGITAAYQGCGNQVLSINPEGAALLSELYTLLLDETSADVYLIATNTADSDATATILPVTLANPPPATVYHLASPSFILRQFGGSIPTDPARTEFDPRSLLPSNVVRSTGTVVPQPAQEGDAAMLWDVVPDPPVQVSATVRHVSTDGTISSVFWVEDASWGTCDGCINKAMLEMVGNDFLKSGADNDVHDWVTAIFGAPWGPYTEHRYWKMLPPEAASEVHTLFLNSDEEYGGYYTSNHSFLRSSGAVHSNERLMMFVNTESFESDDDPERRRIGIIDTIAHEYQHMIRHYQKVVRHQFEVENETWSNEMSSRMAEEFVFYKLMIDGHRGLPYDEPTAGSHPIEGGEYALYNYYNYLQNGYWEFDSPLYRYYATNFALGAYLSYTYGGANIMRAMAKNAYGGVESIEQAIVELGYPPTSFGEVIANWAVANLLSDDTSAPFPYRYNSGTWSTSTSGGISFRLGSVNLFNYRFYYDEGPDDYYDGPFFFSVDAFNAGGQAPLSNRYVNLGRQTGLMQLRLSAPEGTRMTLVVKE